ncbi:unnamed protein product [Triticum turgidum subsp. durum]|uniref:Uncharacterized protein n=1 Tax=Triticum turgidum subsp. durum TaxID=4567 RepID=A0A9R1BEM6_TRITD|nr:unnamed protein product [Triticum turgidum subsp. durum]
MPVPCSSCSARVASVSALFALFLAAALVLLQPGSQPRAVTAWLRSADYSRRCSKQQRCRPARSEAALPRGIIESHSDLEMRSIHDDLTSWPPPAESGKRRSLLAVAAGIKQKEVVDRIATKFFSDGFSIMIFHYDGVVEQWGDLRWSSAAVHVSAVNQTKWWFAKRFLHPDIVHEYDYIFVWDEDLGVQHFHPARYVAIVEKEGLQISQPALDATNSKVHHWITARARKGGFHRFVEIVAPVFSRAAWHCVWHMIQNYLIHAWGLDFKFGCCAQGGRSKNVGVVDSEYLLHLGIPTLGSSSSPPSKDNKSSSDAAPGDESEAPIESMMAPPPEASPSFGDRSLIRHRAQEEQVRFQERWKYATQSDACWVDPYVN